MSYFEHEMVYTVNDYWDGPRVGVADVNGKPHYFECIFDEASDDWTDRFWLREIEPAIFQLVLEDWKIWEGWRDAFHAGKAEEKTHPCLPEDRDRHEAISIVLKEHLRIDRANGKQAQGSFEIVGPRNQLTSFRKWTGTWRDISKGAIQQTLGADSPVSDLYS